MKIHQNHRQKRPKSNADAVAETNGTASFMPPPLKLTAEPVEVPKSRTANQRKEQEQEDQQQDSNLNNLTKANIQVKSGDKLENLVKSHYPDYDYTTGNDRRAIVEATYRLNQHDPKSAIYLTEDDRSIPEWAKDVMDPNMAEQRKIYRTAHLRADATLRLPKVSYIDMLRSTGELGQREDWMNDAIGLGKSIAGFTEGIGAGFLSTAGSTVEGLWAMLKSVLTGEIVGQAVKLYKQLEEMGISGILQALKDMGLSLVDQFMDAWNNPNPYQKWLFMGKIVGAVVFEVILAWATMGVGTAIRGSAFFQKFASKFSDMAAWMGKRLEGLKGKLGNKANNILRAARRRQRQITNNVENGTIDLEDPYRRGNYKRKGNYGEIKMDTIFESNGYSRIGGDRITDIDAPITKGIDAVYENSSPPPKYVIAEAKYGTSKLNPRTRDGKQMSDGWVMGSNRLNQTLGEQLGNTVLREMIRNPNNVQKVLFNIDASGQVFAKTLDGAGKIIGNWL